MRSTSRMLLTAVMSIGLLGCQEKKRDIVTEVYPDEQKQVEKVVHDILDAAGKKDLDRLEAFHLPGPKFTKFDDWEPLIRQDAQTAMKAERDGFSAIDDFKGSAQELKVDVFGDVAIATFVFEYSMKMGETTTRARARSTMVFVKDGGAWKITHEHFSPFKSNP